MTHLLHVRGASSMSTTWAEADPRVSTQTPNTSIKFEILERINLIRETNGKLWLMYVLHVGKWLGNSCEPGIYMGYMRQHFRLFQVSNLSVLNFRHFFAHVSRITVFCDPVPSWPEVHGDPSSPSPQIPAPPRSPAATTPGGSQQTHRS